MEFDINHIAILGRLGLNELEKEHLAKELLVILDYIQNLNEVDTSEVKPISQITGSENVTKEDKIKEREEKISKQILDLGPDTKEGFIKIKRVLE